MTKTTFMIWCITIVLTLALPSAAILKYGNRTVTNQRIEAAQGSTVSIRCRGGSNPIYTWKKGTGSTATSLPIEGLGVFQAKSSTSAVLRITSLTPANTGVYACHIGTSTIETVTVAVASTQPITPSASTITGKPQPTPVNVTRPKPMIPSKVQGVTVTKTVQGSSPALRVSWNAVSGSGITYTVCYSTTSGTQSDPPSNANCGTSGITGTSTTLGPLSRGTTYYIWVRAVSSGGQGLYSDRRQGITYNVPGPVTSLEVRPSTTAFGLIITWGPPSGSNYPTPVTYQLRYRERPSSGPPGGWNSTVQRTATQRQYTTPVLKPGTRYEVEVWAVSSIGRGQSVTRTKTTYQLPGPVTSLQVRPAITITFGLIITWGPPSGSNHPTPVTYRLRYCERPSSGPSGSWSRTIHRITTQRQYTTTVLKAGTRYKVEVWAVSAIGKGQTISRTASTRQLPGPVTSLKVRPSTTIFGLIITWGPPSGSNYPTPVTYQLRYHERPSSGSLGGWSSTVQRTATQRPYTTPVLKPGTRYEVEVWAVVSSKSGTVNTMFGTTASGSVQALNVRSHGTQIALVVTWRPPSDITNPTGYKLRYHKTSSSTWSSTRTIGPQKTPYTITDLEEGATYEVEVWATFRSGEGSRRRFTARTSRGTTIQITAVTTHSISLVPSPPSGTVYYKEVGSSAQPRRVRYSNTVTITRLQPNTEYNVTYVTGNGLGVNRAEVKQFTLPTAVSNVRLSVVSSKSLNIFWKVPEHSNSLMYHINYSSPFSNRNQLTILTTSHAYNLTGLHPYEEYTISVQAGNRAGLSVPVTGTARTSSDKPFSVPTDQVHIRNSSRWCLVSWKIPPERGRHGIITRYIIELDDANGKVWNIPHDLKQFNFSFPDNVTHNLTNLTPHTTYKWKVAAATVNGTGRFTPDSKQFQTHEEVPGPVSGLLCKKNSSESVHISWSVPREPNGDIRGYNVSYREIEGNASEEFKVGPEYIHKVIKSLKIHTPYEVTVTAKTSKGAGVSSSCVFFTEEGMPTKPVEDVAASRVDGERVNISWTPLSLVEARGFPLYTVSYMSGGDQVESVSTNESNVIISGLSPRRTYTFTIRVSTGNGTGKTTSQVTLHGGTEGGGPASAVAATVAVMLIIIIAAIIAICIVVYCRRRRKTSAMMPVRCEKKGENKYTLGFDSGGKNDIASIVDQSLEMDDFNQKLIPKKSFLAVTKQLHLNRDRGFEDEFKTIDNDPNGSDVIAKTNRRKNRYGNINTYDHCRVVLSVPDENGSDYINASYINGFAIDNAYVASQGPTPTTVSDFWQMIWDQECPVIVMLTKVEEKGKAKCHQYWEDELLKPYEPGRGLEVTVTSVKGYANYEVREITLSNTSGGHSKPHKLKQFHYTGWPDHGVPTHPSSLVKFVQQVRKEYKDSTAPLLVHCSAGVGRTGTFITVDAMLERVKQEDDLNIYQFVTAMRTRRTFMVQTMEQYAFIHDALCDYLTCGDTSVAAHELRMEIRNLSQADTNTGKSGFQQQFELLDSVSKKPVSEDESFSRKATVVKKNRYKDKFPYSNCFVRAPGKGPTGGADYMNASYIDSYSTNKAFIAAQAPLESTKNDVWEMIWQYKPSTVVVLCDLQEEKQEACSRFWPDEREKTLSVGFLKVNNKCTERDATYDITRLEVFDSQKESSKVLHVSLFHLKDWDKDGRPNSEAVLRLMGDVQNTTASSSGDVIPAVVMCDDGMGRSGVFICAMSEVERVKVEGQVDVFQTIKGMRIQRPYMVETPDQYKLCFDILQSYLDSFDTYANFKAV